MKKVVGVLLILLSVLTMIALNIQPVKLLRSYPSEVLEKELDGAQMAIDVNRMTKPGDQQSSQTTELKKQKWYYKVEIYRRQFMLDWFSWIVGLLGVGLIYLHVTGKTAFAKPKSRFRVVEAMPAEIYANETEFYQKTQEAFTTREEAIAWFENDPVRVCAYCGEPAVKPIRGTKPDEIQLVTFYKTVPSGAKDLRIVLGTSWFVRPASELQCENCQQKIQR